MRSLVFHTTASPLRSGHGKRGTLVGSKIRSVSATSGKQHHKTHWTVNRRPTASATDQSSPLAMDVAVPDSVTKGNPEDNLVIYGVSNSGNTASSASVFVSKLETYCRIAGLPYETEVIQGMKGLKASPKHTMPFIKHGDVLLADSTFIIEYLTNTYPEQKVHEPKDEMMKGVAVAAQRICEDHLVHGLRYHFWIHPKGWVHFKKRVFGNMMPPFSWFVPGRVRKEFHKRLYSQGFGRHSEGDIQKLLDKSFQALSQIIGENKFLTGKEVCKEDAIIFATLDVYLNNDIEGLPLGDMVRKYPNLVAYVENMRAKYYDEKPSKFKE